MSRHWRSFVNDVTNVLNISRRLLASDILTESELDDYKQSASVAGKTDVSRRKQWLVNFFSPYYEQINLTYRNQDEGLRCIGEVIERIREIRSQDAIRQQEIVQLEAEKAALEERIARLKELSPNVPITPPPPQPLPRYEGSAEQLYNQASFEAERQEEQEQNPSPIILTYYGHYHPLRGFRGSYNIVSTNNITV